MKLKGYHDLGLDCVTPVAYFTAQIRNFHGENEDKYEKFTMIVAHWTGIELCVLPSPRIQIYRLTGTRIYFVKNNTTIISENGFQIEV